MKVTVPRMTLTPDWDKVGLALPDFRKSRLSIQEACKRGFHPGQTETEKPLQHFVTGSSYEGSYDSLGFSGFGTYVFPHGTIYEGYFKDGQFHGKGVMTYPVGHKLKGFWKRGKMVHKKFVFYDGLEVSEPWKYCQLPDRRFQVERSTSLRGPDEEFLTNRQPTIDIPAGCYDTVDGFYVPDVKCVFKYDEEALENGTTPCHRQQMDTLKRMVLPEKGKYIEDNYRTDRIKSIGYRPDLYEVWMNGKSEEVDEAISDLGLSDSMPRSDSTILSVDSSSLNYPVNVELTILR